MRGLSPAWRMCLVAALLCGVGGTPTASPATGTVGAASRSLLAESFESGAGAWTPAKGTWSVAQVSGGNHVYRQTKADGKALSLAGDATWTDYRVEARVAATAWKDGNGAMGAGIVGRGLDGQNYYVLSLRRSNNLELRKVTGKTAKRIAQTAQPVALGAAHTIALEFEGTTIRGYVDGGLLLTATDETFTAGRAGVWTENARGEFDDVTVTNRAKNEPPQVEAGADQIVRLGAQAALEGLTSDDGLPEEDGVTCTWSKASGPGTVTFSPDASRLDATARFGATGSYQLNLDCTDSALAASDSVPVTVLSDSDPLPSSAAPDPPVGWASVDAWGQNGTTGGAGGASVTVENALGLLAYIKKPEPFTIRVDGTITLPSGTHRVSSDKTIVGVGAESGFTGGGLTIGVPVNETMTSVPANAVHNVIVRNLNFRNAPDDAINVQMFSHHVWIDHNDLSAGGDGLIDIKRGSSYVTVSWNHFHQHTKTMLLGSSDTNGAQDRGRLDVTFHHNWFEGTDERNPRVRFGEPVHVFNNYYVANGVVGVACQADAGCWVEGNVFERVKLPMTISFAGPAGRIVQRDNLFIDSGAPVTAGSVEDPADFYTYLLDDPATVKDAVTAGAGPSG